MAKLLFWGFILCVGFETGLPMKSIYHSLFDFVKNHSDGPDLPPVYEINQEVTVHVQMGISGIYHVDRVRNEVELAVMVAMNWQTGILWNPKEYNDLDMITVDRKLVWYPHIAIKNAISGYDDLSPMTTTIKHDGVAWTMNHFHLNVACDLSKDDKCTMVVIMSTHGNKLVHLKAASEDVMKSMNFTSFFDEFSDKSGPFQIKDSSLESSSHLLKGIPGRKERVEFGFSFRDRYRRYSRFPTAMFSWE